MMRLFLSSFSLLFRVQLHKLLKIVLSVWMAWTSYADLVSVNFHVFFFQSNESGREVAFKSQTLS